MRSRIAEADFPDSPGVYIVHETADAERPLYVGVAAKQTIKKRWKRTHLGRQAGASSLRRTLGVYLNLVETKLKKTERYNPEDVEAAITAYLKERWIEFMVTETGDEARTLEVKTIKELRPTLNVTHSSLGSFREQYERIKRFLVRIHNQDRDRNEYEDDLWSFFQNAWHLRDWIKNDSVLEKGVRDKIDEAIHDDRFLLAASDLANRSKHLELDRPPKSDARVTGANITAVVNEQLRIGAEVGGDAPDSTTTVSLNYTVNFEDHDWRALDLAEKILTSWKRLLDEQLQGMGPW